MDKDALILNIQRMSTEDGPGLRTTVFFKGCSLSCKWCHNPESISRFKEVQWVETKCIGCGTCTRVCPNGAISHGEKGLNIDRQKCRRCFKCEENCPAMAIEVKGEEWEVDRLAKEVIKDRAYFESSGGGVTVSGGEALLQDEFLCRFLKKLKDYKIHTAVDTCGMCAEGSLDRVMPFTDLVLYDIKLMDSLLHKKFTGHSNERIISNILYAASMMRSCGYPKEIWIRTPIIPGATDSEENIDAIGRFINENISDVVTRWDLCAFNNLCRDKYRRLDLDWQFKDCELMKKEDMERLWEIAVKASNKQNLVHWSGATRLEKR